AGAAERRRQRRGALRGVRQPGFRLERGAGGVGQPRPVPEHHGLAGGAADFHHHPPAGADLVAGEPVGGADDLHFLDFPGGPAAADHHWRHHHVAAAEAAMKSAWRLIVAVVVLAVVIGVLYWPRKPAAVAAAKPLVAVNAASVERIAITQPDQPEVVLTKSGSDWKLDQPYA